MNQSATTIRVLGAAGRVRNIQNIQNIQQSVDSKISLDIFIISWPGYESRALEIENSMSEIDGKVHVIYSHGAVDFKPPPHWVVLSDDAFYGAKFLKSLELCSGDVMLQIQADADCGDWPGVVEKCQSAFAKMPDLGLWAPLVDWTPWSLSMTSLNKGERGTRHRVSMVDGIVWALGVRAQHRMRELDYSVNRFGRGIDLAAASFAMAHSLMVVVDSDIKVTHPRGSGYSETEANAQLQVFLDQLDSSEKLAQDVIQKLHAARIREEKRTLHYRANQLYRGMSDPLYRLLKSLFGNRHSGTNSNPHG